MKEEQYIYLIGFIIASGSDEPNFFALYVCCGENDRPIAIEGEILLFQKPELAASVLMKSDDVDKDKFKSKISQEIKTVHDIDSILQRIAHSLDTSQIL